MKVVEEDNNGMQGLLQKHVESKKSLLEVVSAQTLPAAQISRY